MTAAAFGSLLKQHRKSRRFSQLDLAAEADISTRHLSFMETGRATPSREMILHLGRVLSMPLKDVNLLLMAAGYAQLYQQRSLDDPEMASAKQALQLLLDSHEPYPAIVMDNHWNLLMMNQAQQDLMADLLALGAQFTATTNLLEMFFAPKGIREFVVDWQVFAVYLLQRVEAELLMQGEQAFAAEFIARLTAYPGVPQDWRQQSVVFAGSPMVKLTLKLGNQEMSLFSTIAGFGSPLDVTLQGIRIEHYFPADQNTLELFKK